MRKVSMKVFLSTLVALLLASMIPRLIDFLVVVRPTDSHNFREVQEILFGVVSIFILGLLFNFNMNRIIVKRIHKLNSASEEVTKGNYDIYIEDKHHDEVSEVIENFNTMTEALKNNEYLNRDFVRNFSHEFKTPLSVIKGYSELMESSETITEEEKGYLEIIISESNRLSNLSQNMMLISLVDNTTIIPMNDTYNLAGQVRSIIQMMQLKWETKNIELDINLEEVIITSNKELLYHVLLNLIGNAIKFSDDNMPLRLHLKEEQTLYKLDITNTGQLIPKDDFDKVFNLFYVSSKSRSKKSTGIGLTLTKKIVDKLHGDISFTHNEGITTFTVTLPK